MLQNEKLGRGSEISKAELLKCIKHKTHLIKKNYENYQFNVVSCIRKKITSTEILHVPSTLLGTPY